MSGLRLTVSRAAAETGWSPRMLRYLEAQGLVAPRRTTSGYRLYGLPELNRLRALAALRRRFDLDLSDVAFARRLAQDGELRRELNAWLAAGDDAAAWIDWEQQKHERLLAA